MVSGISSIHIFKYSGSSWSLLRTVSGLISYEDIKINYDASRILLKYDWFQASNAIYASYDNLLILIIIRLHGNVLRYPYLSPSKMMKCL
jgi:hypothetical protein